MRALHETLRQWVQDFGVDLRRRSYAERTIHSYCGGLLLFVAWVETQDDLKTPGDLTTSALERYQMHLMLRPAIQNRRAQARTMTAGGRNTALAHDILRRRADFLGIRRWNWKIAARPGACRGTF